MSAWSLLAVREMDDGNDGIMYPLPSSTSSVVEYENADGSDITTIPATGFSLYRRRSDGAPWSEEASALDIDMRLFITDCRLGVACSRYEKGGGWIGTSALALPLNAISMARAASRRRGKMLVGHIRYPWLALVGAKRKAGFRTMPSLRIITADRETGNHIQLILYFKSIFDPCDLAAEVAQRAAEYRLATEPEASEDKLMRWRAVLKAPPLLPAKGEWDDYHTTPCKLAEPDTAYSG